MIPAVGLLLFSLSGIAIAKLKNGGYINIPRSLLIQPEAVSGIADSFNDPNEDNFILNSWMYVASEIDYSGFASYVTFMDSTIRCQRCVLPLDTLNRGYGNCVGKAALLTSILRNRLPSNRIYMVLGELNKGGVGGHAWLEVQRQDGGWYVIESTSIPKLTNPWVPSPNLEYIPSVYFNDAEIGGLVCLDHEICVAIKASKCPCEVEID